MPRQHLPCPHCSKPIAFGFWNLRPGRSAVDGFCRGCLKPYRFGAASRRLVVGAWLAYLALAVALYEGIQHCAACIRLEASPGLAWVPAMALALYVVGAFALTSVVQWLYLSATTRVQAQGDVLEPVADDDVPFTAADLHDHPAATVAAALLLLGMLGWAIVAEMAPPERRIDGPVPAGDPAAAAGVQAVHDQGAFWSFLTLDIVLALVVIACALAFARRMLRLRERNAGTSRPPA